MSRPIPPVDRPFAQPTSTTDSEQAVKPTHRFSNLNVQFIGTFAGGWDVDLEGSNDGVNWESIQAGITAAANVVVSGHWNFMRVTADVLGTQSASALSIVAAGLSDP